MMKIAGLKRLDTATRILLILVCLTSLILVPSTVYPFIVAKGLVARVLIELALALWLFGLVRPHTWTLIRSGAALPSGAC